VNDPSKPLENIAPERVGAEPDNRIGAQSPWEFAPPVGPLDELKRLASDPHLDPKLNPKHDCGRRKQPFRHIPPIALAYEGRVMAHGADKYGGYNWGVAGVVASVYYDAILRHLFAWYTGEDIDPESGQPHLAHIRACAGILIDCAERGIMEDDRPIGKTTKVA